MFYGTFYLSSAAKVKFFPFSYVLQHYNDNFNLVKVIVKQDRPMKPGNETQIKVNNAYFILRKEFCNKILSFWYIS